MEDRKIVAKELAKLFHALSHPDRIRIIEELARSDYDVQGLSEAVELPATRVSQHLALFRGLRLVQERREGKHHFYSLVDPAVAQWILDALKYTELGVIGSPSFEKSIKQALKVWTPKDK